MLFVQAERWGIEAGLLWVLLAILVQDWRLRGVYWYLYPLLIALGVAWRFLVLPSTSFLADTVTNLGIVGLQVFAVMVYLKVRFRLRRWQEWQLYLGLGDVLFWVCATVFFAPVLFLGYFVASLLTAAFVYVGARACGGSAANPSVPLAGLQAGFLACLLMVNWAAPGVLWHAEGELLTCLLP